MRSDEEVREVPADVEMGMITAVEGLHPTLKFASDTWQNREAQSKKRIEDHESRERLLTNEIYQLVGFASAFQSLLLTAVAQGDSKKNIITRLKRTLSTEVEARKGYSARLRALEELGNEFSVTRLSQLPIEQAAAAPGTSRWVTYNDFVVVCVLLLGVICFLFIYRILCNA
ncbi:hypothetical protein BDL97_13G024300 [Sphagnum fallax]|nr:hypothetical protein BDL97_13G024300 [Sphagnum fallax]